MDQTWPAKWLRPPLGPSAPAILNRAGMAAPADRPENSASVTIGLDFQFASDVGHPKKGGQLAGNEPGQRHCRARTERSTRRGPGRKPGPGSPSLARRSVWPRRRALGLPIALALGLAPSLAGCGPDPALDVFAAASTQDALSDAAGAYSAGAGSQVKVSPGGSSALAQQIRHGAPADIFVSANPDWMDSLEQEGLIAPGSRFDLLANSLVLIARGGDADPVTVDAGLDLAAMLGSGRIAMAFVDAAPAGIYGKSALQSLGLWDSVSQRLAQTENVRGALALVSTGQARLGIVYRTDAAADDNVTVIGSFPPASHPPIRYPVAAVAAGTHPGRSGFLDFLRGPAARAAFESHGFDYIAG